MTPEHLAQNLRQLKAGLPDLIGQLIAENAHVIEDLQTAQMDAGLDSEGKRIEPDYSPFTVQIKRAKGQPYDRVTLKDSGSFHAGMFLTGGANNQFSIGSRDPKSKKLQDKYGEEIFGLNEDSQQQLIDDHLRPELPERVKKVLNI